ncbi:MAG TPA: FHA domain-containing serine/threonine-protein kinase [Chthoniobacteraceae bacterium]|jgi:serine/threonine-protein kinase|nr:FHA domain-containing serine/threonine-protein kinase [Chthoniobacteraceae bacterium]
MSAIVKLEVLAGPWSGREFRFDQHDTFVFGRAPDCHIAMPADDKTVSRHHFLLETNPPDAVLRDLGSLNGTRVNGVKHGGRAKDETPEEARRRRLPEVKLKDGDRIQAGDTTLVVRVLLAAECCECGQAIADADREKCGWIGGLFICAPCKAKLAAQVNPAKPAPKPAAVRCEQCGREVAAEAGVGRRGAYTCEACRQKAVADPAELLKKILREAAPATPGVPEIDGYELGNKLGEGAFGAVYRARRKRDGTAVAVKIILARVAVSDNARAKFLREVEVMKDLLHRNVVALLEHGSAGSAFYFIMELCEGGSVYDWMKDRGGKLILKEAAPAMRQCLEGLAHAHAQRFVHRDLKPANLLLAGAEGKRVAKLGDFGMAKSFEQAGLSGMTVTGSYGGTPGYMPREQVINFRQVKPVTDVWSIGATFYCMLTGQVPRDFPRGVDPMEVVLGGRIVPLRERDAALPKKLAEVIDRSLAMNPQERYQDAAQMLEALVKAL